ncbi:MAG: hypothetical protein H6591_05385 [Flavobacteriales bacterium]|nr:hypothetical protein [Flavobacteriales bacterium]
MRNILICAIALSPACLAQQAGSNDPSFNTADYGFWNGTVPSVNDIAVQPDGRIVMVGQCNMTAGHSRTNMFRVYPDGSLDLSFDNLEPNPGGTDTQLPHHVLLMPDGKVVVAGFARSYGGLAPKGLLRFHSNGQVDPSFAGYAGHATGRPALRPDGRILADRYAFLPDGTIDPNFDVGYGFEPGGPGGYHALPDNSALAYGAFELVDSIPRQCLARLHPDGSVDTLFVPDAITGGGVRSATTQADGRIIICGDFTHVGGQSRNGIARLYADGTLDATFQVGSGFTFPAVGFYPEEVLLDASQRILVVGGFDAYNGVARGRIVRLDPDGSLDSSFDPLGGANTVIRGIALDASGRIHIAGAFTSVQGFLRNHFACLSATGELDHQFNMPGLQFTVGGGARDLLVLPDGDIIVGGWFSHFNNTRRNSVLRLDPDGNQDPGFSSGTGVAGIVHCVAADQQGRVLLGGSFSGYNGVARTNVLRLLPDGSLDMGWDPGQYLNGTVTRIVVQPDGKMLLTGAFTQFNGVPRSRILRLNVDGSLDGGFDPGIGAGENDIRCIALQPDGRMIVGGYFLNYNGVPARIVRLNADGTQDPTFVCGTSILSIVNAMVLQPDGKLVVGAYHNANGAYGRLCRLLPSGAVDPTFDYSPWVNGTVYALALQSDGKVIVGGLLNPLLSPWRANNIARLNTDGSDDLSFQAGTGPDYPVQAIAFTPDGDLLLGGYFRSVDGQGRNGLARLFADAEPGIPIAPRVLLGGPYVVGSGSMTDALRAASLLPLTEPFSAAGYAHVGGGGGEMIPPSVLTIAGPDAITDWVLVELRDASDASVRIASRSVLVQRDGDVVSADGTSPVIFNVAAGSYHVSIRHRNHLGVMTASPVVLSSTTTTIDFTAPGIPTWGTNAQDNVQGTTVLWPGDANSDGVVKYVGMNNDRDPLLVAIGGNTPTNVVSNVYSPLDVNMDGRVQYVGNGNDRDFILTTVGGSVPTATRTQQLP